MFSKAIFAGSSGSSSFNIICSIELERFGFLGRGCETLADSFSLIASVPMFVRLLTASVDDGVVSLRVVVKVLSCELILEVDGAGLFSRTAGSWELSLLVIVSSGFFLTVYICVDGGAVCILCYLTVEIRDVFN